jgi:hypothetical protein
MQGRLRGRAEADDVDTAFVSSPILEINLTKLKHIKTPYPIGSTVKPSRALNVEHRMPSWKPPLSPLPERLGNFISFAAH